MAALGNMAHHPIDKQGSFGIASFLNGVLRAMPFRDGLARAVQASPSLYRTLTTHVSSKIGATQSRVAMAAFSCGASSAVTHAIANCASDQAPSQFQKVNKVGPLSPPALLPIVMLLGTVPDSVSRSVAALTSGCRCRSHRSMCSLLFAGPVHIHLLMHSPVAAHVISIFCAAHRLGASSHCSPLTSMHPSFF